MAARLLLRGQLAYMREYGFDVTVVSSPGAALAEVSEREGVRVETLPISREIEPVRDARTLAALVRLFKRLQPDVVSAGTTKAGLLGTLGARLAGVPVCIYTLRGLRLETTSGLRRLLLTCTEHVAARSAHRVVAVSPSLAAAFASAGFAPREKIAVIHRGSSNGVDLSRFEPTSEREAAARSLRAELGIEEDARVIGFVGRFVHDKGIVDLVDAFEAIHERYPRTRLLLVGDFEIGDPVPEAYVQRIEDHPSIVQAGFVADVAPYYHLMDVLAFPSRREGFPNAPLEAAAAGVPTVGCIATGTVDAVQDGVTGALVEPHRADLLEEALLPYVAGAGLAARHGEAARTRAAEHFRSEHIWEGLAIEFSRLLREKGRPLPATYTRLSSAGDHTLRSSRVA